MKAKKPSILLTSSENNNAIEQALDAYNKLESRGYSLILDDHLALKIVDNNLLDNKTDFDIVMVFGGDGAILKTYSKWADKPILGVNCGKVGFLTEIVPNEIDEIVEKLDRELYFIEECNTVEVSTKAFSTLTGANDVVVSSTKVGQTIRLIVKINDQHLYTLVGDGVVVASSVGSSAYSRSAGGSLIMPSIDALIVVPICPFLGRFDSMVVSPNTKITIKNIGKYRSCAVTIDGQTYYTLGHNETIDVTGSKIPIKFIRFSERYVQRVKEKLLHINPEMYDEPHE